MIRVELINMKIKITYETERSLILRNRTRTRAWCERCNAEADFVPNQEIVSLAIRLNKKRGRREFTQIQLARRKNTDLPRLFAKRRDIRNVTEIEI